MAGISGGIGPSRYAPVEAARSGALANGYSVRQAPPTTSARSTTRTSNPARATSAAATRPAPRVHAHVRRQLAERDPVRNVLEQDCLAGLHAELARQRRARIPGGHAPTLPAGFLPMGFGVQVGGLAEDLEPGAVPVAQQV